MSTAVVTDSTADIPQKLAADHSITIVPAILIIGEQSMEDGSGISREEFYGRLPTYKSPPSTAAPSAGAFEATYRRLISQGFDKILSIHCSSLLSGIFASAKLGGKPFGDKIHVIDSEQLSLGLGFQVLEAAEAAAAGQPIKQILLKLNSVRKRVRLIAMLDTLEYVRRSGRVSWTQARIGSLLRIKPFLEVKEGTVHSLGQTRTWQRGVQHLVDLFYGLGPIERLGILHTNVENEARRLIQIINGTFSSEPLIVNVTTVVGTHVGPHGLGFAAVTR